MKPSHQPLSTENANAVVITGVSSGIGYDAVRYLIGVGYHVFGSVRSAADRTRLEDEFGDQFTGLTFDVTDRPAVTAAAEIVSQKLNGRLLTALVNNAGVAVGGPLQLLDGDRFEKQIAINLFGTLNVTNAFLPHLGATHSRHADQKPGKIINISSISGILNTPMSGSYCVAKHAMESLGEVYRRELLMYGIDVLSIQSGPIRSEIWAKCSDDLQEYEDSDYRLMVQRTNEILEEAREIAQPAEVISRLIHRLILSDRPKLATIVHPRPLVTKLLAHWLPARLVDRLLFRSLNRPVAKTSDAA